MLASLILAFLPMTAPATTVTVEKVGRQKAIISFPSNVRLTRGSRLYLTDKDPSAGQKRLRPRKNFVEVSFLSSSQKTKEQFTGEDPSETTTNSSQLISTYGYNTGRWMPWASLAVGLGKAKSDGTEVELKTRAFGVGVMFNFIKNEPENRFIPYASLGIGFRSTDHIGTSSKYRAQGKYTSCDFGLLWYPFGELAAVNAALTYLVTEDLDISGDFTGKSKDTESGLKIGYVFSF